MIIIKLKKMIIIIIIKKKKKKKKTNKQTYFYVEIHNASSFKFYTAKQNHFNKDTYNHYLVLQYIIIVFCWEKMITVSLISTKPV